MTDGLAHRIFALSLPRDISCCLQTCLFSKPRAVLCGARLLPLSLLFSVFWNLFAVLMPKRLELVYPGSKTLHGRGFSRVLPKTMNALHMKIEGLWGPKSRIKNYAVCSHDEWLGRCASRCKNLYFSRTRGVEICVVFDHLLSNRVVWVLWWRWTSWRRRWCMVDPLLPRARNRHEIGQWSDETALNLWRRQSTVLCLIYGLPPVTAARDLRSVNLHDWQESHKFVRHPDCGAANGRVMCWSHETLEHLTGRGSQMVRAETRWLIAAGYYDRLRKTPGTGRDG